MKKIILYFALLKSINYSAPQSKLKTLNTYNSPTKALALISRRNDNDIIRIYHIIYDCTPFQMALNRILFPPSRHIQTQQMLNDLASSIN